MNLLKTTVFLLFFTSIIFAQSSITKDTIIASQYFKKADALLTDKKLDSSIVYFKKALSIYERAKAWERVAGCYNRLTSNYLYIIKNDEVLLSAEKALSICKTYLKEDVKEKAEAFDNLGNYYMNIKTDVKTSLKYYNKAFDIRKKIANQHPADLSISYLKFAYINIINGQYDEAKSNLQKALELQVNYYGENHYKIVEVYDLMGYYNVRIWNFDQAQKYYNKSLKIRLEYDGAESLQTCISYRYLGRFHYIKGENDIALKYLNKVLYIEKNIFGNNHYRLARTNLNIAIVYKEKGQYNMALDMLKNTQKIVIAELGEENSKILSVYYNIASIYHKTGESEMALNYYGKMLYNLPRTDQNEEDFANVYNKIGLIYGEIDDYDKAEEYLKKSIHLKEKIFGKDHIAMADSYNNLGIVYRLQKKTKEALKYYQRSLKIKENKYEVNHREIANSMKEMGNLFIDERKFEKAEEYLIKALHIREKLYGKYSPKTKVVQNLIGYCHYKNKKYDDALSYYESALQVDKKQETPNTNFGVLLTSLKGKSQIYSSLFKESQKIKYLDSSEVTYQKAKKVINAFRHNLRHFKDKLTLSKKAKEIYHGAIANQLLAYNQTKDKRFLKRAFSYNEQGKSNMLKELLFSNDAIRFSGLNPDLIQQEKNLKIDRSYYQSQIAKERSKKNTDSIKLAVLKDKLFTIMRKRDSLTEFLEKNYPKYHQLKYNNEVVSVVDIQQKLNDKTTLLEFFTSDSITYAFTISKNKIAVKELTIPKLTEQVENLRATITDKNTSAYKIASHQLYQLLITPIRDKLVGNELIIVPDGPLWHLNFDLLLSEQNTSNNPKELSYLLKDYVISYANSATLLFSEDKTLRDMSKKQEECLAFSFSDSTNVVDTKGMSLATLRDTGDDLPGTRKEIKAIADIIDGKYYYGSKAVEANFKQHASQYNILHLALHGEVDNERPENSRLFFTKSKDTIEDNFLYSHELFALDIPAELTVLSACNTGTGKIAKGEGIMSLGNAFQYAGTKSLLLSSWEVSDQTTPELMKYFYTNLKEGMSKAKALQQAKLQYLGSANLNRTHPFYWGGFYLLGDTTPVQFNDNNQIYWWIGIGVFALILVCLFWYRKKNSSLRRG